MKELDQALIDFLQKYIRVNTAMPYPNYDAAHVLWEECARYDGLLYQRVALPSGYDASLITIPGKDSRFPALLLNHHMDVVPAFDEARWTTGPFEAIIRDGRLIGRGVQDTKTLGALHYYAVKSLLDVGYAPQRTIHFLAVPDEECGGFKGTQEFLDTPEFKRLDLGFVLDEAPASGNEESISIKIDERKPLQIRITARGALAHGSRLRSMNAIHILIDALSLLVVRHKEQQKIVHCSDGELLSLNITSLSAGVTKDMHIALNVVPDYATATVDIRVPPSMSLHDVRAMLDILCHEQDALSYSIEATVDERESITVFDTPLFNSACDVLKNHGLVGKPFISEGASDLRFYKRLGIDCIGFAPFTSSDNAHGIDEALTIAEIIRARKILTDLIKTLCFEE